MLLRLGGERTRIGKMKRRKQDEGQRDGSCMMEDDSVDIENENGNRFEEYEWCGQKRIRATTLLEGGFRGLTKLSGVNLMVL
uniref:Uncharacterized protein n=1 Tax=Sphaerodactylus townsendi TaxID=933632 RepID=A0ACB8F4K6_9SAUR